MDRLATKSWGLLSLQLNFRACGTIPGKHQHQHNQSAVCADESRDAKGRDAEPVRVVLPRREYLPELQQWRFGLGGCHDRETDTRRQVPPARTSSAATPTSHGHLYTAPLRWRWAPDPLFGGRGGVDELANFYGTSGNFRNGSFWVYCIEDVA